MRRLRDPEVGQPRARLQHGVEVHHRLAHAHEHRVVDRSRRGGSGAPGRGSPRRSGCARSASGRSRRTCTSAGSPTARTGTASAGRPGSASAPPRAAGRRRSRSSALTVPSLRASSRSSVRRRERHVVGQLGAQREPAGPSSRRSDARRARPTSTPGRRDSGLAELGSASAASSALIHAAMVPGAVRLAKYLATAGVASRRAAEEIIRAGRVTVGGEPVLDPARDVDRATTPSRSTDGRSRPRAERVVYALNKPVGVVSTARDTARPPDGRLARAVRRCGCTRSGGSTSTAPG